METRNGSHFTFPVKLAAALLLSLALTVSSTASAGPGQYTQNTAYQFTLCYPNASTCQTANAGGTYNGLPFNTALANWGMPQYLYERCAIGSYVFCPRSVNQDWYFQFFDGAISAYYNGVTPTAGVSGGVPNHSTGGLYFNCVETNDSEFYTCTSQTGGPGYTWTLTVKY